MPERRRLIYSPLVGRSNLIFFSLHGRVAEASSPHVDKEKSSTTSRPRCLKRGGGDISSAAASEAGRLRIGIVKGELCRISRIYGVKVFHTDLYSPYQVVHTVRQVDFGRWRSIEGEKGKKKKKRKRRKKKKRRRRIPRAVLARG
ncbi:hypothetical protein BHE74_00054704 [Ensete ventricosum]|nr:hypothetical protein BHE74_00054704 [Ensete ventricosum]